jgi:alkylhydroperoxidase family enzyme
MLKKLIGLAFSLLFSLCHLNAFADGSYSRLPDLPDPPVDPILKKEQEDRRAAGGQIINLQLTTGHAPKIMMGTLSLAKALRLEAQTPRLLREIAIIRTAGLVGSDYELNQHHGLAKACGYPQAKIQSIQNWRNSNEFDNKERALLSYVDEMAQGGNVSDETFSEFSKYFTSQEIIEVSVTISSYYGNGLLTKALKIKPEQDGRITYPGKC